ncbi:MAG: twin-arginine translocase subunit TatC [Chloroflexi bacterium]|nr:twin-arginine translocase subunit TatC [Chloroflexota bacterium]
MATDDRAFAPLAKLLDPGQEEFEEGQDVKEMTLLEHLDELRQRLIYAAIAVGVGVLVSLAVVPQLFDLLLQPARSMDKDFQVVFTELTEYLGVYMRVGLFAGLILAMPVLVYQLAAFIAPALTRREKRALLLSMPPVFASFLTGVAFGYYVLVPPAVSFLINFGRPVATPMIKIESYVGTVTTLLLWIGVSFETPFVMFLLAKLGIVKADRYAGLRRYAAVVAFVLAAFITPTFDPVNQTLVALPIIVLFEIGIWLSKLA